MFFVILLGLGALLIIGVIVLTELSKSSACVGQMGTCGLEFFKSNAPKVNGLYIPDVEHAILLIVLVIAAIVIATLIYNRTHDQSKAFESYKRSKALYDQYMAVQKARLDKIARMYYTFK